MANEKFTQLPTVTSSTLADIIAAVQGGVSVQQTLQQVATLLLANTVLHYAGNPNGNVAGTQYQLLWDTVNNIMYVCTSSGNAATAVWTLSGSVTFPVPMAQGGTGKALVAANGGIVYSDASSMEILAPTATANQMFQSGANSAPAWSTSTYPATNAINTLLYASAANVMSELAPVNRSFFSTNATGVPTWIALTDGQIPIGSTSGAPAAASITAGAGISVTPGSNSITIAATSGSGSPLTTKGDLYTFTTVNARLAVGTVDGQMLQVSAAAATGLAWSTATYPPTTTINQLLWSSANNVVAGMTTANSAIMRTNSSGVPAWSASMTNGQLMIGSTGATPVLGTLTAGTNISIVNAAGTITISSTGLAGFSWTVVTGTSQAMLPNNGYIANNAGLVSMSLPATSAVGDEIDIIGKGAGGWKVTQGAGQSIVFGSSTTTVGAGGSLASTNAKDSFYMICTVANLEWTIASGPQGNITVV